VDEASDGVRDFVHVDAGRVGVQADGVQLVAVLHRQFGKTRKVFFFNSLSKDLKKVNKAYIFLSTEQ